MFLVQRLTIRVDSLRRNLSKFRLGPAAHSAAPTGVVKDFPPTVRKFIRRNTWREATRSEYAAFVSV
jgi:hypothetical protein